MELRQLKYYVAIARSGSFKKASIELRIAQPALSRQIGLLEHELGVKLLNRLARGSLPTQEGKLLLERAQQILDMTENVRQELINCGSQVNGDVSIGLMPSLCETVAPELLARVRKALPDVRLHFHEGLSPRLRGLLTEREVDLAVLTLDVDPAYLLLGTAFSEPVSLIGPADDPFLQEDGDIEVAQLSDLPLILTGIPKNGIRDLVDRALQRNAVALNRIVAETQTSSMARRMAEMRLGYAVLFRSAAESSIEDGKLAARPIAGLRFNRIVARSSEHAPSRAVLEVERVMTEILLERFQRYRGN